MWLDRPAFANALIFLVVGGGAAALALAEAPTPSSAPQAAARLAAPSWRYRHHDGRWWYWLPSNSWAVYENQRWVAYDAKRSVKYSRAPNSGPEQWPHGHTNGSDATASTHAGGTAYQSAQNNRYTPHGNWPHGSNGSEPHSSPRVGGHVQSETSARHLTLRPTRQQQVDDDYRWRNN